MEKQRQTLLKIQILLLMFVISILAIPTAQAQNRVFLQNVLSGKCIDVSGAPGTANGAPLILWDCERLGTNRDNGSPTDQLWNLLHTGFIQNTLSGKCIDVSGAPGTQTGAKLLLWDCEFSGISSNGARTDQIWTETNGGFIKNLLSGLCIDVRGLPGNRNGDQIQLAPCEIIFTSNGSVTDQKWQPN